MEKIKSAWNFFKNFIELEKRVHKIEECLKYGAYQTPTKCPHCHKDVEFIFLANEERHDFKLYANHKCPECGIIIKTQITNH